MSWCVPLGLFRLGMDTKYLESPAIILSEFDTILAEFGEDMSREQLELYTPS